VNATPEVLDGVRDILAGLLLRDPRDVRAESLLVQDLEVDSLGLIEMTFAIEERFGITFPDLKTSAEILLLPLPEGMRRIAAMPGGTTLFEFIEAEVARAAAGGAVADAAARERLVRGATVAELARAVGGAAPIALAAETPLAELRVADLFRVVTVGIVARYVEFLRAAAAAPAR
jgi:acyl carrier protein